MTLGSLVRNGESRGGIRVPNLKSSFRFCTVLSMKPGPKFRTPLKRKLDEAGWDQKSLAEASGVPESTVSRLINGRSVPSAAHLLRLAKTLACEPWELLDDPDLAPERAS